jgi:hypothetical protein
MFLNLNKKQKIVLVAGMIFLIILVATTPRYYETGEPPRRVYSEGGKQLDLGEAFLRVVVVVLITGGLIILLKSGKKEDQ